MALGVYLFALLVALLVGFAGLGFEVWVVVVVVRLCAGVLFLVLVS